MLPAGTSWLRGGLLAHTGDSNEVTLKEKPGLAVAVPLGFLG